MELDCSSSVGRSVGCLEVARSAASAGLSYRWSRLAAVAAAVGECCQSFADLVGSIAIVAGRRHRLFNSTAPASGMDISHLSWSTSSAEAAIETSESIPDLVAGFAPIDLRLCLFRCSPGSGSLSAPLSSLWRCQNCSCPSQIF